MTDFLREVELRIGSETQDIIFSNDFRIDFGVVLTSDSTENRSSIKIYNLAQSTYEKFAKEYRQAELIAGYSTSGTGLIYRGLIDRFSISKSSTDVILDIMCSENKVIEDTTVNMSIPAGTPLQDAVRLVVNAAESQTAIRVGALKTLDAFFGDLNLFSTQTAINAFRNQTYPYSNEFKTQKILSGTFREVMDKLAFETNSSWTIINGIFEWVHNDAALEERSIIIINENSGMIGSPSFTDKNIEVVTTLNHSVRPNNLVSITSRYLEQNSAFRGENIRQFDGGLVCKVLKVSHSGSNYLNNFQTSITCVPILDDTGMVLRPARFKENFDTIVEMVETPAGQDLIARTIGGPLLGEAAVLVNRFRDR